jgi:potassium efflux system protein
LFGGALAIGIGFGSQNLVNNFISGIIMMIEEPIKIGDYIEVEGLAGTVEEIGARSTKIISLENKHYIVPNSSFLEKNVLNWTLNNNFIRTEVAVGVAYGTDATKVKEILMGIAKDTDNIRNYPEPFVLFDDFGDSALVFKLVYWFDLRVIPSVFMSRSDLRFRIDKAFKENKITIAFPSARYPFS